ncbi:MBL fold metallo-hydrolase [Roseibium salinum]|uniref:MBL fold metallo-hydrolase n=1 Tax=Roseibium salinum TaxID=1604349 RepID=A0ABT3R160_9HYPH|nr:MBL fold metallo-hydrolase [Roseibium sp. DSM 29163]MCX2722692.1 MBL fold metallo-hydrolase [Roseibium sp. DSM 29163]
MSVVLTILGCGSSGGVPRIGNDWGLCDPNEVKNRRSRCALLVEKYGDNGCTTVLIDTGPDIRQQLLDAEVSHLDAVLYTHAHADHLHGIDDLRAFTVHFGKRTPVYMDASTYRRAYSAFTYCFETPEGSNYPPILVHHPITPGKPVEISGAGGLLTFETLKVTHGDIDALGFKIGNAAYLPDVSDIPVGSIKALKDLDVLILDCLRRRPHPSHFCLEDSLAWTRRLAPERTIFTNLHNDLDYKTLCEELPETIEPAFDGMRIELTETPGKPALSAHAG